MNRYKYLCSSNNIWTSFDHGEAENKKQALIKAKEKLSYDLEKCNTALLFSDNTKGFHIEFDLNNIEIEQL